MKSHIEAVLEEIKSIATFNANSKFFDDYIYALLGSKIKTRIDIKNLSVLTKSEDSNNWYECDGEILVDEYNKHQQERDAFFRTYIKSGVKNNVPDFQQNINITVEQAAEIVKDITKSGENVKNRTEMFKEFFCDKDRNYNPKFIQYITSFENIDFSSHIQDICYNFIKAFLNAEFLIFDDFSTIIEKTIENINIYYENDFANIGEANRTFYLIKSFIRVLNYAIEMCEKHRNYFNNPDERLICVNNDRKLRFYRTRGFSDTDFVIGKKESLPYERLMESVVDMTIIDLDYTVTEENFDKLFRLWQRIEVVENYLQQDQVWKPVFLMLKTKTAILLMRMLNSKINNKDYRIVNIGKKEKKKIEDHYKNFIKTQDFFKQNPFIEIKEKNRKKVLEDNQFNELLNDSLFDESKYMDIYTYDNYVKEGREIYCNNSKYFNENLSISDIDNLNEFLKKENHKHFNSQTLFVKLIAYLHEDIEKKLDNFEYKSASEVEKKLSLLSNLLVEMERFTERAKTNKIKQFAPAFAYSFYEIYEQDNETKIKFSNNLKDKIEKYDAPAFKKNFFIASTGLSPVNIFYLEAELIKWEINIQKLNFKYDHIFSKEIVKTENEIQLTLRGHEERIEGIQRETITILGILGALLAFVTASIGLIKIANNLFEYAVFGVIFTSSLLMFVVAINLIWKKREKNETKKDYFWKYFALPLSIIVSMVVGLFGLQKCNGLKENNIQKQKTEISIKADVQNHNSGEINMNCKQLSDSIR